MKKVVELPLDEPLYSTYNNGIFSAVVKENPTIRNYFLNEVMNLKCNRKFLSGITTPEIDVFMRHVNEIPCFEIDWFSIRFLKGYVNVLIRNLIDSGYYIYFFGVDDYYIEGKSWYKKRHLIHDGAICGYNQKDKTYCMYSYDSKWIYKKFWTPQKGFNDGIKSAVKKEFYGYFCAIKPKQEQFELEPNAVLKNLKEYLDSSIEKYPKSQDGDVYGIAVHDYIAMYVDKLYDGSIPYERMDWRVFRLIWEHKKVMLERISKMEQVMKLDSKTSVAYEKIVSEANDMRMLYASHHMRRRDSVLPIIRDKLILLRKKEQKILNNFIKKVEGVES